MVDACRTLCVGRSQLDEGIAADLDEGQRRLSLVVANHRRLAEAEILSVVSDRFVHVADVDADVVHAVISRDTVALRAYRHRRTPNEDSDQKARQRLHVAQTNTHIDPPGLSILRLPRHNGPLWPPTRTTSCSARAMSSSSFEPGMATGMD